MSTLAENDVQLTLKPVTGLTGAEICGLSSTTPVTEAIAQQLRAALRDYAVIFMRGQGLDPERHRAIAGALGKAKEAVKYLDNLSEAGFPEIGMIRGQGQGTARWHTDLAWTPRPVRYSVLHMQELPDYGGDTCWANQYAAFEHLSEPMQAFLESLTATHQAAGNPERAVHPLVISNPDSRRRALFFSPLFTTRINELTESESDAVLAFLGAHATKPEFICRWRFAVGDVAIWDNQYVMHYAVNDYGGEGRKIHRIEIEGSPPELLPPRTQP
jgi:taurine dioxygenase